MAGKQRREVELPGRVEPLPLLGDRLPEKAIGADDLRLADAGMVEHQEMVADTVVSVAVAPGEHGPHVRHCRHLLVEDAIAQPLGLLDLVSRARQPDLEGPQAAKRAAVPIEAPPAKAHPACEALRHQRQISHGASHAGTDPPIPDPPHERPSHREIRNQV